MNKRMITSETWSDDFFTSLSMFDRLLWIGILTCCDDQGRLKDKATNIKSLVFPEDEIPCQQVEAALNRYCQEGKIARYIVGSHHCIQIINWWKHQTPRWAGKSIYPPPDGWIDRERYHQTGGTIATKNWDKIGGYIAGYITPCTKRDDDINDDDDIKGDIDDDGSSAQAQPQPQPEKRPNIFKVYEQNIGGLSPIITNELIEAESKHGEARVTEAITEAVKNNVRRWSYVKAILEKKRDTRGNGKGDPETLRQGMADSWGKVTTQDDPDWMTDTHPLTGGDAGES